MTSRTRLRSWRASAAVSTAAMLALGTAALTPAAAAPASPTTSTSTSAHAVQRGPVDALSSSDLQHLKNAKLSNPKQAPSTSSVSAPASNPVDPIDMRVLVMATSGDPNPDGVNTVPAGSWDWDLSTLTDALDYAGVPYDVYRSTTKELCVNGSWKMNYAVNPTVTTCTSGNVTPWSNGVEQSRLWDGGVHAYYQGVMQTNGTLSYSDPTSGAFVSSALTADEWSALWTFESAFGIRTVSANTYPTADFGLTYKSEDGNGSNAKYTAAGASAFPQANASGTLPISNAWTYRATTTPGDTTTTPLMTDESGNALAVIHTYPNQGNRQALALTFDSAGYLTHGEAIGYGLVSWVTKGLFLGERHTYLDPQPDDVFIADSIWQPTTPCGTAPDDPSLPEYRITGSDLAQVANWQKSKDGSPVTKALQLEMPFNGEGTTADYVADQGITKDTLVPAAKQQQGQFKWVNHTYTHMNLDYQYVTDAVVSTTTTNGVRTSTLTSQQFNLVNTWDQAVASPSGAIPAGTTVASVTNPATVVLSQPLPQDGTVSVPDAEVGTTQAQATSQLTRNDQVAKSLGLKTYTKANLIQPDISGLKNPFFLQAAVNFGVKYLISDTSRTGDPASYGVNEGRYNTLQPSVLEIARYPVNLYFNVSTPQQWLAEDNCLYPAGAPFGHVDTYQQLLDRESNVLLRYMLQGHNRPLMFHQPNLKAYDGTHSVLGDLMDATLQKYSNLSNVPLLSPTQDVLGQKQASRMQYNDAWKNGGLSGSIVPGKSITLTASKAVTVPVTGVKAKGSSTVTTEVYGGQNISYVTLAPGQSVTLPLT